MLFFFGFFFFAFSSWIVIDILIAGLGVAASDSACIFVIVTPTGPYFRGGTKGISLLAVGESVRSWPGGTGGYKLGLNYAPGFLPQRLAAKQGYDQILWLLGEDERVTEVGAMNFFVVVQREDGRAWFFYFFISFLGFLTEFSFSNRRKSHYTPIGWHDFAWPHTRIHTGTRRGPQWVQNCPPWSSDVTEAVRPRASANDGGAQCLVGPRARA